MLAQYEAAFTIHSPPEQDISEESLLNQVVTLVTAELEKHAAGNPPSDAEQGAANGAAYAAIRAERQHPRHPQQTVRLEARFCTVSGNGHQGAVVAAQIHTRYIATDTGERPTAPAGPPRLLHALIANFDCRQGTTLLSNTPVPVAVADLSSPSRSLPALVISEDQHGETAINPEDAALWLAGLATVSRVDEAGITDRKAGPCHSGSARLYWPVANGRGAPLSKYYAYRDAARLTLYALQNLCLKNAPESYFEGCYVAARTEVVQERNRQLEAQLHQQRQPAADPDEAVALRKEARRERIRAGEATRKLNVANERINALAAELESVKAQSLQSDLDEPEHPPETKLRDAAIIDALTEENQTLKAEISRLRIAEPERPAIPLTGSASDNITIINHAVNIYREPMRRYIAPLMKQTLGDSWGEALIDRGIVAIDRNRTRQLAIADPMAFIDTDIFADIASSCPERFTDRAFIRTLREIQGIRNRAAHPPPQGIPYADALDGLSTIAGALAAIGDKPAETAVLGLTGSVTR